MHVSRVQDDCQRAPGQADEQRPGPLLIPYSLHPAYGAAVKVKPLRQPHHLRPPYNDAFRERGNEDAHYEGQRVRDRNLRGQGRQCSCRPINGRSDSDILHGRIGRLIETALLRPRVRNLPQTARACRPNRDRIPLRDCLRLSSRFPSPRVSPPGHSLSCDRNSSYVLK